MSSPPILMSMVQAAPAGEPSGMAALIFQTFPFVIIFAIFYVLWIRPQQRRVKDHQATIAAVKKGDEVVTGGGHIGKVTKVSEGEVEVEIAQGVRVRAVKSTLTTVLKPNANPAND